MPLRLRNGNGSWPAGGFPFVDPRTGKVFDGMSADLTLQAKNIIAHRKANPKIYPASEAQFLFIDAVKQEVLGYICARRPSLCADSVNVAMQIATPKNFVMPSPPPGKKCYRCGSTDLKPVPCKTCGGFKIKSWLCNNCQTSNPK